MYFKSIIPLILFASIFHFGVFQNYYQLDEVEKNDTLRKNNAIIYGDFIQRLGFSSGGFPQEIVILNIETNQLLKFNVKPTFKSRKENPFFYHIPPGSYKIINYLWTQSKWYGGKMYNEPIFKDLDTSGKNYKKKFDKGEFKESEFERFEFTVELNKVNYLGTWHFDNGLVSFSDDKKSFEIDILEKFNKIDFKNSVINITYVTLHSFNYLINQSNSKY